MSLFILEAHTGLDIDEKFTESLHPEIHFRLGKMPKEGKKQGSGAESHPSHVRAPAMSIALGKAVLRRQRCKTVVVNSIPPY